MTDSSQGTRRASILLLSIALSMLSVATVAIAEEPYLISESGDVPLLRGSPLPTRKIFPVIQLGVLVPLGKDSDEYDYRSPANILEAGAIVNLSKSYGVGASFFYSDDGEYTRTGVKARMRRWLSSIVALDVAPGVVLSERNPRFSTFRAPGFVGELAVSFGDVLSIMGQIESMPVESYVVKEDDNWYLEKSTEVAWYFGTKVGGEFAVGGMVAAFLLREIGLGD